jgi:plastocyanin
MADYYVLGAILVLWGLGLAVFGLLRADFPPSGRAGRVLIGVTVVIVAGTLVALLTSTQREHPREEAAAEELEKKEASEQQDKSAEGGQAPGTPTPAGSAPEEQPESESAPSGGGGAGGGAGATVAVTEDEFSIKPAEDSLEAGKTTFAVKNAGKIQHDLVVDGVKGAKTKLIDGGGSAKLDATLKAGKYKLFCSVPGHEQAGMRVEVTVK